MTNSLKRSTFGASLFVVAWFVTPAALTAGAFRWLDVLLASLVAAFSLIFCLLLTWRLAKRSKAQVFRRKTFVWRLDRVVERSFVGAGSLAGWTSSNPNVSLADLRAGEAPLVNATGSTQNVRPSTSAIKKTTQVARPLTASVPEIQPEMASTTAKLPVEVLPAPVPDTAVEYVVQRGDTYWSLAEKLWGDGSRWSAIQNLNVGRPVSNDVVLVEGSSLVPGWNILLPQELRERR